MFILFKFESTISNGDLEPNYRRGKIANNVRETCWLKQSLLQHMPLVTVQKWGEKTLFMFSSSFFNFLFNVQSMPMTF